MKLQWLLISVLTGFSSQVIATQLPPSREDSLRAFKNFKRAVTEQFQLPEQSLSLPDTSLPSSNCSIRIKDVSIYGNRVMMEITSVTGHWSMSIQAGEPSEFFQGSRHFTFKALAQDCEEQGCDGNWYVSRSISVDPESIRVFQTEPYSRKSFLFSCDL